MPYWGKYLPETGETQSWWLSGTGEPDVVLCLSILLNSFSEQLDEDDEEEEDDDDDDDEDKYCSS